MRILLLGATGQLGRSLIDAASHAGHFVRALNRSQANLADPHALDSVIKSAQGFDLVVNAAAYTAVDKAENDIATATLINSDSPGRLATAAYRMGLPIVHVSTDYVFDGKKVGPYLEDDPVAPLNVYGATKLAGERTVRSANPKHLILRTSWVFSPYGGNFVKTMVRIGKTQDVVRVVADQFGRPTYALDLATAILEMVSQSVVSEAAGKSLWGTYHFAGADETSWYGFAEHIFRIAGLPARLEPISSVAFASIVQRPVNSVLDCGKAARVFGLSPRSWNAGLQETISTLAHGTT